MQSGRRIWRRAHASGADSSLSLGVTGEGGGLLDRSIAAGPPEPWTGCRAQAESLAPDHAVATTLLDAGALPVEEIARLCEREGWRPRPVYGVHRWFARRFGTAVRALLTAAATPVGGDFWRAYYDGPDLTSWTVLDPFVGGGTSVVEARRLGASVTGVDIDAVACAVTRLELRAGDLPDLGPRLDRLTEEIGEPWRRFYRTVGPDGKPRDVLHFFWVQVVACRGCGEEIAAHPHYRLAYEAEGNRQWALCAGCGEIHVLDRAASAHDCAGCGTRTFIAVGPVRYGRLACPRCGAAERLIDLARRTGTPPRWRLFALESVAAAALERRRAALAARCFQVATADDRSRYAEAERALAARRRPDGSLPWVPDRAIPRQGRSDDRLPAYGYDCYAQLFNARQLLHLSTLVEAIATLPESEREAFGLAFSDHLTTNCLMSAYAFGWRRLTPLFSLRAYRHVTRPVELNPWLDGIGRGTFPHAVRAVQRAATFARAPREPRHAGGFVPVNDRPATGPAAVLQRDARDLSPVRSGSVDLVLTDPPYFDNIAYAELSDFYLPWLHLLGLAPDDGGRSAAFAAGLAARARDGRAADLFGDGLAGCFREIARVLKPGGRAVFTYQHRSAHAWTALARAIATADLHPVQVFPLLGDHRAGLHAHAGNSRWDAVFVLLRGMTTPPVRATHASPPSSTPPRLVNVGEACLAPTHPGIGSPGCFPSTAPLTLSPAALAAALAHQTAWADRLRAADGLSFREPDAKNLLRACLVAGALGMFDHQGGDPIGEPLPLLDALETHAAAGRKG